MAAVELVHWYSLGDCVVDFVAYVDFVVQTVLDECVLFGPAEFRTRMGPHFVLSLPNIRQSPSH